MTDKFLIHFALSTFVALAFGCQHVVQILYRRITKANTNDKNIALGAAILALSLVSIAIMLNILEYQSSK